MVLNPAKIGPIQPLYFLTGRTSYVKSINFVEVTNAGNFLLNLNWILNYQMTFSSDNTLLMSATRLANFQSPSERQIGLQEKPRSSFIWESAYFETPDCVSGSSDLGEQQPTLEQDEIWLT